MPGQARRARARIKVHEVPEEARSAGEHVPLEYPHLYTIRAGDWRISYAVEHNRLAILVLEVVSADEEPTGAEIPREEMSKIMKIKLLDLPEELAGKRGSEESRAQLPRIKIVNLSADNVEPSPEAQRPIEKPKIKLTAETTAAQGESALPGTPKAKPKVTLLDDGADDQE